MYLSSISIKNFRCFDEAGQTILLNNGITFIIGENDSGKSAVLDAIKLVLGTTDQSWQRVNLSDFYEEDTEREISIVCKFQDLSIEEEASFLENLSIEEDNAVLYIHWNAKYMSTIKPNRIATTIYTGINGDIVAPVAEARELLRVTHLRAPRDAYNNMQSGRNSRLSQIINNVSDLNSGDHVYVDGKSLDELSLTGIADLSNKLLANHKKLNVISKDITDILKNEMLLKSDDVNANITVSDMAASEERKLIGLLEKLDLTIVKSSSNHHGRVGLGTSNILSMACELLLNQSNSSNGFSSFLLIEEPEAHIHAQRQLKLIKSLQSRIDDNQQIILTTHSPILSSVISLKNIVILKDGKPFPMAEEYTKLENEDYRFLERYLDATKANLFFARSIIIVEGPSEELLLPTIAKLLGKSFTDYGISVVNVMSTGLRRYARIFQRKDECNILKVKVACITDRDVMPDCAPEICINEEYKSKANWPAKNKRRWVVESEIDDKEKYIKEKKSKADGQFVNTFVSDNWTLEYDLAFAGLTEDILIAASKLKTRGMETAILDEKQDGFLQDHYKELKKLRSEEEKASYIYSLFTKKTFSKAEFAQELANVLEDRYRNEEKGELLSKLPNYIVEAINYVTE
ncbi:ATP-dependent nuclease [Gudongella sp. DL1XJH-153]|uniref:ATP-dependent nuclease n=1 Tax=Gudongella sp. DL1XJH-153 TaxID=3409804 RepID=UPI003BB79AC6